MTTAHWTLPIVIGYFFPDNSAQRHSEDEAGRQLAVYFVFGGTLFFLLSAWIGWICAANWRKAAWMIPGSITGTILVVGVPRLFSTSKLNFDGWHYDLVFVIVWVATSTALAYFFGRFAPRNRT